MVYYKRVAFAFTWIHNKMLVLMKSSQYKWMRQYSLSLERAHKQIVAWQYGFQHCLLSQQNLAYVCGLISLSVTLKNLNFIPFVWNQCQQGDDSIMFNISQWPFLYFFLGQCTSNTVSFCKLGITKQVFAGLMWELKMYSLTPVNQTRSESANERP